MAQSFPLALIQPFGRATSATITVTNDDGTTETRSLNVTQIDALVSCGEKYDAKVDIYTAAFAAGGAGLGFVTDRWDIAVAGALVGAMARNYLPEDGACQSVWNAIFDVMAAVAAWQIVEWVKK